MQFMSGVGENGGVRVNWGVEVNRDGGLRKRRLGRRYADGGDKQ
jgi:hypothetical protein